MQDEPAPPRKSYGFKPKEFERANPARAEHPADALPVGPDPGISAANAGNIDVNDLVRAGAGAPSPLRRAAVPSRENDVHAMLRENHAHAAAAGLNEVSLEPKRSSKRKRDYIFLLVSGNLILSLAFVIQPVFAVAGVVLFNIGLAWIMWVVMDNY